jgi:hypothetical protein
VGKSSDRPAYNLHCAAQGKDLVCKQTIDDQVVERFIERGLYLASTRRIECLEGQNGLNCTVK